MSLPAFQEALGALIADRAFCQAVREDPTTALASHDLSPRDIRRLAAMASAPGMTASGTLYRINRLTPLNRSLPRTLMALGPSLPGLIDAFWDAYPETRLQFEEEATRFIAFVTARIEAGAVVEPLAIDMLAFEAAACRLLFQRDEEAATLPASDGTARLHPLVSVVRFRIDPATAFAGGAGSGTTGEHYVVLDARGEELKASVASVAVGRALALAQAGQEVSDDAACRSARAAGWLLS